MAEIHEHNFYWIDDADKEKAAREMWEIVKKSTMGSIAIIFKHTEYTVNFSSNKELGRYVSGYADALGINL